MFLISIFYLLLVTSLQTTSSSIQNRSPENNVAFESILTGNIEEGYALEVIIGEVPFLMNVLIDTTRQDIVLPCNFCDPKTSANCKSNQ